MPPARIRNHIKLERFERLVSLAGGLHEWLRTADILASADLSSDSEGGRGALKMLHVLGDLQSRNTGRRRTEWRLSRPEPSVAALDLTHFEELFRVLTVYEGNYIATDELMHRAGLERDRPGTLGALKTLEVKGLVRHHHPTGRLVEWMYGDSERQRARLRPAVDPYTEVLMDPRTLDALLNGQPQQYDDWGMSEEHDAWSI